MIPTVTVAIAVLTAYHLGASTGIGGGRNAGLFGTGIATMGMLSNAVYILSMNNYGPVAVSFASSWNGVVVYVCVPYVSRLHNVRTMRVELQKCPCSQKASAK